MKKKNIPLNNSAEKSKMFIEDRNVKISAESSKRYNEVLESPEYAEAFEQFIERVIPNISVREPSTFCKFGSAQKYYEGAFSYIYNSYPYDGSGLEKLQWANSASAIDLGVLQHEYPKETGHVIFSSQGWGILSSTSGEYGLSSTPEYIKFSGGPYVGTVFDVSTGRTNSLKIDGNEGNTIEFWLKKEAYAADKTDREVVVDIFPKDYDISSQHYSRFRLEIDTDATAGENPFIFTYRSGSSGFRKQSLNVANSSLTKEEVSDGQWHHYAISVFNSGSNLVAEFYVDGTFDTKIEQVATVGAFNGYMSGRLGSLGASTDNGAGGEAGAASYGKLSGSLDEFRFWKTKRTAEEIGNYYDYPVHGASDKEVVNNVLGVYYKFNEGIAENTEKDKVILDYSGRVNNGEFVGVSNDSRNTGSAITLSSATIEREIGDPIIDPTSPRVVTALSALKMLGSAYDEINHGSIFKSVPQWAFDTTAGSSNLDSDFSILLHAIAHRFDSIKMIIDGIPKIGYTKYRDHISASGSVDYSENFYNILGCEKDFFDQCGNISSEETFSVQNLVGRGFNIREIPFADRANLNEYFYNLKFEKTEAATGNGEILINSKVNNLKNKVLNSVYVNLSNIYKTKGTNESFRNLIRCFGVDENLLVPNMYGQNIEKEIKNEPVEEALGIKSIAFRGDNNSTTVYQTASQADERAYIEGDPDSPSFSIECKTIFPYLVDISNINLTASVFGMNEVQSSNNLQVTAENYSGLTVTTVKSELENKGCYFKLTSRGSIFEEITTEYHSEVYANSPWLLAVRFSEDTDMPFSAVDNNQSIGYKVEFIGYRYESDVLLSQFHHSASITPTAYQNFVSGNKSIFAGAARQNITGSLEKSSDAKILYLNVWDKYLKNEEIKEHALGIENIGVSEPLQHKVDNKGVSHLDSDSLVLSWQFDDVDTSAPGQIGVLDFSDGSHDKIINFGNQIGYKYPATTCGLQNQDDFIEQEYITTLSYLPIDNLFSRSKIEVKKDEVETFQMDSRPVSYLHSYEKSMYQVISKEMLNMLAGAAAFNNIIGTPVHKYRQEYKSLEKLRERFFIRVKNEIELENFIEYYKWIDSSLGKMLEELQPATSTMNLGLEDVVESHALERNKYKHQAPQFEFKKPKLEGQILGINELLYDWEHGHAPPQEISSGAIAATASITCIASSTSNYDGGTVTITDTSGVEKVYIFDDDGDGATGTVDGSGRIRAQISGFSKDGYATQLKNAILSPNGHYDAISISGPSGGTGEINLTQLIKGESGNVTIVSSLNSAFLGLLGFDGGSGTESTSPKEDKNCLWWSDRAERTDALKVSSSIDSDRETLKQRRNNVSVGGSTYVLRKLIRPYKLSSDRQVLLNVGSNRNANKNKALYKVVDSGQEITLNKADIYEFKKCSDILDPQEEKIYTAKTNVTNTAGYLDADADYIFPFTLYSSSAGIDFSDFKENLAITNNHDDYPGVLQGPFVRQHAGGSPHRRVQFGTADDERPEAYLLSSSATSLVLKSASGQQTFANKGSGIQSVYSIGNIKTDRNSTPVIQGNYDKIYEIVLTNARSLNNRFLIKSGSLDFDPVRISRLDGFVDYKKLERGRAEHVFVNRFSSPGGAETQAVFSRDKESGEYSVYNTVNYRNLSIRRVQNQLSFEPSLHYDVGNDSRLSGAWAREEIKGMRSLRAGRVQWNSNLSSGFLVSEDGRKRLDISKDVQGSVHKTYHNRFMETREGDNVDNLRWRLDNFYVQSPIPVSDLGYSWIRSSRDTTTTAYWAQPHDTHAWSNSANLGFRYAHNFTTGSKTWIPFPTTSQTRTGAGTARLTVLNPGIRPTGSYYAPLDWVDSDNNFLESRDEQGDSYAKEAWGLNSIISHRQGIYGWPTWKQIRGYEHSVVRAHRRTNIFSRVFLSSSFGGIQTPMSKTPSMNFGFSFAAEKHDPYLRANKLQTSHPSGVDLARKVKNYVDIPATDRFRAMTITLHSAEMPIGRISSVELEFPFRGNPRDPQNFDMYEAPGVAPAQLVQTRRESNWYNDTFYYESHHAIDKPMDYALNEFEEQPGRINSPDLYFGNVTIKKTFQNDFTSFSNMQITKDIDLKEVAPENDFLSFMTILNLENDKIDRKMLEINYIENIYPREINTFSKNAREREKFIYYPWNSNRDSRNIFLSGNVKHTPDDVLISSAAYRAFPKFVSSDIRDYKMSFFGMFDAVDIKSPASSGAPVNIRGFLSSSTWPLDSRSNFLSTPVDIVGSYFNDGSSFLDTRDQGTRNEGLLQNDFSTFPLGFNGIYGTPPFSTVYNRRIPQDYGSKSFLSGEAKWEAHEGIRGPFYDSYREYSFEDIRYVGQEHSLIPEFRISEFAEDILTGVRAYPNIGDDFLRLTGSIYPNSDGDLSIGSKFFKTYSNSDFLKYFQMYDNEAKNYLLSHARINFRCKAAMKFLPYKGLYPADRTVELTEIFHRRYLPESFLSEAEYRADSPVSVDKAKRFLSLRANANRYRATKPFFGPGILFNSIKAGVAVDYPVFYSKFDNVLEKMADAAKTPLRQYSSLSIHSDASFTGSIINNTEDCGIPRIKSWSNQRIQFENILNPAEIYARPLYENEPHPSASLIYGTDEWHKIIERPHYFGSFTLDDLRERLGVEAPNNQRSFAMQMAPYTMAAQNFAAETVNFFVEDGHLTTAISDPINHYFVSGSTHKMRVYVTNVDTVMYDRHSAFGPPVHDGATLDVFTPNTAGGTEAKSTVNFKAPSGYNLRHVTSVGDLPAITIVDEASLSVEVRLYDSTSSLSPSSSSTVRYVDINGLSSGSDVASLVKTNLEATSLAVTCGLSSSQLVISSETTGPKSNFNVTSADSSVSVNVYEMDAGVPYSPAILENDSLSFSTSGEVANSAIFDVGTENDWKAWYNENTPLADNTKYPKLVISDQNGNTFTITFYTTDNTYSDWASAPGNSNSARNVDLYDLNNSVWKTPTEVAANIKSLVNDNTQPAAISATNASGKVTLTMDVASATGTVSETNSTFQSNGTDSTFILDALDNDNTSGIPNFSGYSAGSSTVGLLFSSDQAATERALSVITNALSYPEITLNDGDGTQHGFAFFNSGSGTPSNTSNRTYVSLSTQAGLDAANNFKTAVNNNSSLNITAGNPVVSGTNWSITLSDTTTGSTPTISTGSVSQTVVVSVGSDILDSGTPSVIDGSDGSTKDYTKTTEASDCTHGFLPYVPPFLDPNSNPYVEITFSPEETKEYGAKEIIENVTFEYRNVAATPSNPETNTNYIYSMALSASLNLGICATLTTDNEEIEYSEPRLPSGADTNSEFSDSTINSIYEAGRALSKRDTIHVWNNINIDTDSTKTKLSRWVIQTKWETPVLDFSDCSVSSLDLDKTSIVPATGSPWKTRYWQSYYTKHSPKTNATSGSFLTSSMGMWHQRGETIGKKKSETVDYTNNKGYFLRIKDVVNADGSPGLAEALGFTKEFGESSASKKVSELVKSNRIRIGPVEKNKIAKEAIVAIPYVLREEADPVRVEFVPFKKRYYDAALESKEKYQEKVNRYTLSNRINSQEEYEDFMHLSKKATEDPSSDAPINAIQYQLFMMDNFVLPPQLDFITNDEIEPFMMYFFQFNASFDREDLSRIWQNLYPTSPGSTASPRYSYANNSLPGRLGLENDVSYVSHYLDTANLNGLDMCPGSDIRSMFSPESNNKTRWLVFKVKQRAINNLETIRRSSIDPRLHNIEKLEYVRESKTSAYDVDLLKELPTFRHGKLPNIQFNWPYDYFSFVELIKLDAKIDTYNYEGQ